MTRYEEYDVWQHAQLHVLTRDYPLSANARMTVALWAAEYGFGDREVTWSGLATTCELTEPETRACMAEAERFGWVRPDPDGVLGYALSYPEGYVFTPDPDDCPRCRIEARRKAAEHE